MTTTFCQTVDRHLTPVRRLVLVLVLLTLPLLQMVWRGEQILHYGTKVVLKTAPVDPRSLFQGDYVILNYEISRIDRDFIGERERAIEINTPVYVLLQKAADDESWKVSRASLTPPGYVGDKEILLKGHTQRPTPAGNGDLFVAYGIESFFITENTGHMVERNAARLRVEAYISSDGEARIGQLLLDGKPILAPGGLNE